MLFAESDYITLHTALTPESFRLLSRDAFAKMKKGVRIVNCARGELIDQEALREALASGQVGGAALDVFENEPPSPSDPLFAIETLGGDAAHRRFHRRSAGDRGRADRAADCRVSAKRRGAARRESARADARAV